MKGIKNARNIVKEPNTYPEISAAIDGIKITGSEFLKVRYRAQSARSVFTTVPTMSWLGKDCEWKNTGITKAATERATTIELCGKFRKGNFSQSSFAYRDSFFAITKNN